MSACHCIPVLRSSFILFYIHHKASNDAIDYICSIYFPSIIHNLAILATANFWKAKHQVTQVVHNREQLDN